MPDEVTARTRLLDAAARLFYADGIAATGINAIIAAAGVARMSLYNNFTSKDELVLAYIEARHEEWLTLYTSRAEDVADPKQSVLTVFDAYIDHAELGYDHGFRGCESACIIITPCICVSYTMARNACTPRRPGGKPWNARPSTRGRRAPVPIDVIISASAPRFQPKR